MAVQSEWTANEWPVTFHFAFRCNTDSVSNVPLTLLLLTGPLREQTSSLSDKEGREWLERDQVERGDA